MSVYQAVFFDLDGTLTDPKQGITRSVQYALAQLGIREDNLDNLTPFIGPPLTDSFNEYYQLSTEQTQQAIEHYRTRFSSKGIYENDPLPGIAELLQQLTERDIRLFVATSKPTEYAQSILANFQLAEYFEYVSGSFFDGSRTDKAEVIAHIFATYPELDREQTIMVGDRKFDVLGAQANTIDVVAVDYGYALVHELALAAPTYRVATVDELTEFLLIHTEAETLSA
jgi:Predicted phosphatases